MVFKYIYNYWYKNQINNSNKSKYNIWNYTNNDFLKHLVFNKLNYMVIVLSNYRYKNISIVSKENSFRIKIGITILLVIILLLILLILV